MDGSISALLLALVGRSKGKEGGSTPLMYASVFGHVRIVQTLLTSPEIDVNAMNKVGATALSIARVGDSRNHKTILEMLENAGALAT